MTDALVEVAVFAPLRGTFMYRRNETSQHKQLQVGMAVRVPFGKSTRVGIVLNPVATSNNYSGKIKFIKEVCGPKPLFSEEDISLAQWASGYYHQPLGEVIAAMIPTWIRRSGERFVEEKIFWQLSANTTIEDVSARAIRQRELVEFMGPKKLDESAFSGLGFDWRRPLRELEARGLVDRLKQVSEIAPAAEQNVFQEKPASLNPEQERIVEQIVQGKNMFSPSLLHGVTGSGKTNVYLAVIAATLTHGGQALVLLPEIAITQQLVDRFRVCFPSGVDVMHSGLSDKHRALTWTKFNRGEVRILLGTRSAVWASSTNLKCIIVDEEHDPSYKQQEGFRYNARDIAVYRASRLGIPVVLGSATPSFETYRNATSGKYQLLKLTKRAAGAALPTLQVEDIRGLKMQSGLSPRLIAAINERLAKKEQTILFLNRRGYAPVLLCHQCGAVRECDRCDSKLVLHRERGVLICHQCDKRVSMTNPADCCAEPEMIPLGQGTEQLAEHLEELFPNKIICRIDRDTVRRKSELDEVLQRAREGKIDILLGTQMLAKGHDFPGVTLVGIVDADARLFSLDFRAEERLAQMIIQVAGRAGRAKVNGEVIVQTRQPFHWLFEAIRAGNYDTFLTRGLAEREEAMLPPYTQTALIRAEAVNRDMPFNFLAKIVKHVKSTVEGVSLYGPIPSQLERRAGKFRAEIMLIADTHQKIASAMLHSIECAMSLPERTKVRWNVDIDPQET